MNEEEMDYGQNDGDTLPKVVWIKAFAWKPVRVNSKWTWLTTVYFTHHYCVMLRPSGGYRWEKRYGTIFDVLATEE